MIKSKSELKRGIEIDLTGPDGNAFYLLAVASKFAKQIGFDEKEIIKDMTSSDYEHLLEVFDSYFGELVTLYR